MVAVVRSVSLAFAILRHVAAHGGWLTLSDIARALDLSPSSCLNLLRTLVAEGALEREPAGRRYRLAPDWVGSGLMRSAADTLIGRLRLAMDRFAETHDAAVGLWQQVSADRLALVALAESGAATRIHMVLGQRQPIGGGATGRALAAAQRLSGEELARRFAGLRWARPLAAADYAGQVRQAAQSGFAVDDGFGHAGICSVGTALPPRPGLPAFCLSASVFAGARPAGSIAAMGRDLAGLARDGGGA